jgi:DNA-binding MarR family transcriptional regulator
MAGVDSEAPGGGDKVSPEIMEVSRLVVALVHAVTVTRQALERVEREGGEERAGTLVSISANAARAAMYIYQFDTRTIGQLAAGLRVSYGWASRLVAELEQARVATRERDEEDRRIVRVRLVPEATAMVARAYQRRGRAIEDALAPLSQNERAAVRAFLGRLIENLLGAVEAPEPEA